MPIGSATASATMHERPGLSSSFSNLNIDSRFPRSRPQSSYFDQAGPGGDDLGNGNLTAEPAQMDLALDEDTIEDEITSLMHETRLWRLANSAQWVAWGVVQAHVPGLEHLSVPEASHSSSQTSTPKVSATAAQHSPGIHSMTHLDSAEGTDPRTPEVEAAAADMADRRPEDPVEAEEEGFDYLSYARERALFFWGDALQFGFVTEDELRKWGLVVGTGEAGSVKVVSY
jgi:choline kinase